MVDNNGNRVSIDRQKVEFFNSLTYRAKNGKENEVSGQILLDNKTNVKGAKIFFGKESATFLPQGALTFHKHTVLDSIKTNYMSTDLPSPTDMASIGLAIMYHGALEHLIFTPNNVFTITWFQDALERVKNDSRTMSLRNVEKKMRDNLELLYKSISDEFGGKNYGQGFCNAWVNALRFVGFDIRKFRRGEPIYFKYGPVEASDMDQSITSIMRIESGLGGSLDRNRGNKSWRKVQAYLYMGFGVIVLMTALWAIKGHNNK